MTLIEALEKFRKNKKRELWFDAVTALYKEDVNNYKYVKQFRTENKADVKEDPELIMRLIKESYFLTAKEVFDDFLIAMEWNRLPSARFYLPRRPALKQVVDALQDLSDNKLDILCISLPPGVGKTTIALFYMAWLAGKHPDEGMLCSSHNTSFLGGAYEECLRLVNSEEYTWKTIFAGSSVAKTNAKDMQIAINTPQRFPTFQFTSIGAGNAGKVRAVQLLYCDDLIEGFEEAMSKERLDTKWSKYTVDLKQRKQGNHCKELHIATRWSVHDIIGRIQSENEDNPRARFIVVPALNENGESNFNYGGSAGFTTEFYNEIKSTMDDVSFRALYMNEPIEREGLLYTDLETAYELPEGEPDCIMACCDTAEGGGDNTVMPIFYVYGNKHYLWDVVDSDKLPDVTQPLCANALLRNKVNKCRFESNSAGGRFADCVEDILRKNNGNTHITKKRTTANKETKIIVESDWIKKNVIFKDPKIVEKGSMYEKFIKAVKSYTVAGKNKHDDEVDVLAQYSQFYRQTLGSVIELIDRRTVGL